MTAEGTQNLSNSSVTMHAEVPPISSVDSTRSEGRLNQQLAMMNLTVDVVGRCMNDVSRNV